MITATPANSEKTIKILSRLIGQDEDEICRAAVEEIPSLLFGWNLASIFLYSEDEKSFILKAKTCTHELPEKIPVGGSPANFMTYVLRTGRPLLIPDVAQFRRDQTVVHSPADRNYPSSSCAVIPLLLQEKRRSPRVLGVLNMTGGFTDEWSDQEHLYTLTYQLSELLGRALLLAQQMRHMKVLAQKDMLTGLYNYRFFYEHLEYEIRRSRRSKKSLSLLVMDVNAFKHFNDRFGHLVGDAVLREVARVITGNLREVDIAARYGGDEFLVILPETDL